jgi:uncharacterized damage-inducible protein DinB
MTSEFESDLAELKSDIDASRAELDSALASLSDSDLDRSRRGGWSLRRTLEHVIDSEWLYAILVSHLGTKPAPDRPQTSCEGDTVADITAKLAACRNALIASLDGASEDNFYEVQRLGHEEYSILSVLENVASHDREHAEQIKKTVASTS